MKICINQYAFIAAILSISTALHTKHTIHSPEQAQLLYDKLEATYSDTQTLVKNLQTLSKHHDYAQRQDRFDRSASAQKRSKIRALQGQASSGKTNLELDLSTINSFVDSTHNQVKKAIQSSNRQIKTIQTTLSQIPAQ